MQETDSRGATDEKEQILLKHKVRWLFALLCSTTANAVSAARLESGVLATDAAAHELDDDVDDGQLHLHLDHYDDGHDVLLARQEHPDRRLK